MPANPISPDDVLRPNAVDSAQRDERVKIAAESIGDFAPSANAKIWSDALDALLEGLADPSVSPKALKAKFALLRRLTKANVPVSCDWIEHQIIETDSAPARWTLIEVALDPAIFPRIKRHLAGSPTIDNVELQVALAVLRSVWISGRSYGEQLSKQLPKRLRNTEQLVRVPAQNALVDTDGRLVWVPESDSPAGVTEQVIGLSREGLARFAEAGLPVATELASRCELLLLRHVTREDSIDDIKKYKLGVRVLGNTLQFASKLEPSTTREEEAERSYRLWLAQFIGNRQYVWAAMNPFRKRLLLTKYSTVPEAKYWADFAAVSWVSTADANATLKKIPLLQLVMMWRSAKKKEAHHLALRIARILDERVESTVATPEEWRVMVNEVTDDDEVRRWVLSTQARFDHGLSISEIANQQPSEQAQSFKIMVQTSHVSDLSVFRLIEEATSLAPGAAIPGLALAVQRLEGEAFDRRSAAHSHAAAWLRQLSKKVEGTRIRFKEVVGSIPPTLNDQVQSANKRLGALANRIISTGEAGIPPSFKINDLSGSRMRIGAAPEALTSLQALGGLTAQSELERTNLRQSAWQSLEAVANDSAVDVQTLLSSEPIPPEGWALIWEFGMGAEDRRFFFNAIDLAAQGAWAARSLVDVAIRRGPHLEGAAPLNADLAEWVRDSLSTRIRELQDQIIHPDQTGTIARTAAEAKPETGAVSGVIQTVIDQLYSIITEIDEEFRNGPATGD